MKFIVPPQNNVEYGFCKCDLACPEYGNAPPSPPPLKR